MNDVRLRRWRAADAPVVASMATDPHLVRWSSLPRLGAERWIAEQRSGRRGPSLAICTADDDAALGKLALRLPGHASPATRCAAIRASDDPVGELSYWLVPAARGRGLAVPAVRTILPRARAAEVRSLVLDLEIDNVASIRVAERLGAERRTPERVEADRAGVPRTLAVFVLAVKGGPTAPA